MRAKHFPNLERKTDIQVWEAQRVPNRIDPKKTTPRHIIAKMAKIKSKERIFLKIKEDNIVYKENNKGLSVDLK